MQNTVKEVSEINMKLIKLHSLLLGSVSLSKEDAEEYISEMIDTIQLFGVKLSNINPNSKGFGLVVELYRVQGLLGEVAKEIVFYDLPTVKTLESLVKTLTTIKLYSLE